MLTFSANALPGSLWTVEMTRLKTAGSYYEAVECLRNIRQILLSIDKSDRMKFCKTDYEQAVRQLKKLKQIWSQDLFREVMMITLDFFNNSPFRKLPLAVVQDIFLWLTPPSYCQMMAVSKEWQQICQSNEIWVMLYANKFLASNPGVRPPLAPMQSQMEAFRERLQDPCVGDKIEVAWRGKFRLETQDVYQGLAWWLAEIVDKDPVQGKYKIRYPGWESRWDEWVSRRRLRWTVQRNLLDVIEVGDIVELWCCGANVPGAWLESKVKKIRGGRYCLGRVLSSGLLWVERGRLRLVRKSSRSHESRDSQHGADRMLSHRMRSLVSGTFAGCTVN